MLPYKKYIVWCGTIKNAELMKKLFDKHKTTNLKNMESYIDHSKVKNHDYKLFMKKENNGILFCADKHREGSDIKNL
jgi:hypothetical protein